MKAILIDSRREGHFINNVQHTITVGEVKRFLSQLADDTEIYLENSSYGMTRAYGGIDEVWIMERVECPYCECDVLINEDDYKCPHCGMSLHNLLPY